MGAKKLEFDYVKNYIEVESKSEYTLLSKVYVNAHTKLLIQCNKLHEPFHMNFNKFKSGSRCPSCANNRKLTYEKVKSYIEKESGSGYTLLSNEYKNNSTKLLVQCENKHDPYYVSYQKFKNGRRCPHCKGGIAYTFEYVKHYIEIESNSGYELVSTEYIKDSEKLLIKCNNGHAPYSALFSSFKQGKRCPVCAKKTRAEKNKLDYNFVKSFIESENGYELLSKRYNRSNGKLNIKCDKGHIFYMSFAHFKTGQRCNVCKASKGEKKISDFLEENKIEFVREYRIKECRNKYPLPFDFAIFKNGDLICLIEYQGHFHYDVINLSKSSKKNLETLYNTQKRDKIKHLFCKENNIKLIKIPYWEFDNINTILTKESEVNKWKKKK